MRTGSSARLAKGAVILVVVAIAAELALRVLGFGHPLIYKPSAAGYELVPDQTVNRFRKFTHINSLGTRGPETTPLPKSGTYRILVLGDSVANGGTQINDADTWPLRLQAALARRQQPVEVLNASAGGWSIPNEADWLSKHGTLGAKLIILEMNEKDLDQPFVGPEILDSNISFPSKNPSSALGELTTRYIMPRLGLGRPTADPGSTADAFDPQRAQKVLGSLDSIRRFANANGAKLIILYWDLVDPAPAGVAAARNRMLSYASDHQVVVIRPDLNKNRNGQRYFRDGIHPNVNGNAVIANDLAPAIAM